MAACCRTRPGRTAGPRGRVLAVAGRTATSSGIFGPYGCAQSWGTHTVRHFPGCPEGARVLQVVPNSARGTGGLRGTENPPPQPAAASTTTATSTAHNQGQRRELGSPDAARAERMPAMVTTFCRTHGWRANGRSHTPRWVIGSPGNYGSATRQRARGPNVPLLVPRLPAKSSAGQLNPAPARILTAWTTPARLCTRLTAVPGLLRASLKRLRPAAGLVGSAVYSMVRRWAGSAGPGFSDLLRHAPGPVLP